MNGDTVVLVPGIWMPGRVMSFLKHRLEREYGIRGHLFSYASVSRGLDDNAASLNEFVERVADGPVHVVGHSLGGVLALRMVALHPGAPPGRIVCLGSPLCGSCAASGLGRFAWGQKMLGKTITAGVIDQAASHWAVPVTEAREIGIIAGTRDVGIGKFITRIEEVSDGTVTVAETRLPGARDHLLMHVTHTGLVWSAAVADQAAAFLKRGEFLREA